MIFLEFSRYLAEIAGGRFIAYTPKRMTLYALALVGALNAVCARATESASPHYSNVSVGGAQTAVSVPAPKKTRTRPLPRRKTVKKNRALPSPRTRRMPPVPRPRPAPVWPWTLLGAGLVAAAAVLARSRENKRDRAAGETLALAAHELKSPLAAIESYLDLMALDAPEDARKTRQWLEDVQRMKSTASHLRRTIGDILDMTRIEDGRIKLSPRRLPLGPLLAQAAEDYGALAQQRNVRVIVEPSPGLPDAAADPDRLRQVLHNLLGNALKFTPAGRNVHLRAGSQGSDLFIEIQDEGIGVPADKRAKLFSKFARLAPALDGTEGTGLGLYISRRLVEAQGGLLTYEPGPDGRGSVLRVALPQAQDPT